MARKVQFFDGASSSTTPTIGNIVASNLVTYADDAAYEAAESGAPAEGNVYYSTNTDTIRYYANGAWHDLVDDDQTQTLENKTIDGTSATGNNIITIDSDDVSYDNTASGLSATDVKGAIDELENEIDLKEDSANKGVAGGYASLDGGGKVPGSQLPNSVMEFKGFFDPGTATFTDAGGNAGDVYEADTAGSYDAGSGSITYAIGDWAVHDGSVFVKSLNSNEVTSVNSQTGTVVLDTDDISEGTNKYESAQASAGEITAGTETSTRSHSPADIVSYITQHGTSGDTNNSAFTLENLGLQVTVAANSATISLKQSDGSTNPAAGTGAVSIAFDQFDGSFNILDVTSALSVVIDSGATIGHINNLESDVYIYALDNAGTVELAVSNNLFDESELQSTSAISGAADSSNVLYSEIVRSNVPIRLIGLWRSTQTTAGTWQSVTGDLIVNPEAIKERPNRTQTKILSSDHTADGTITDLSFNNLVVGRWYEVKGTVRVELDQGAANTGIQFNSNHNGSVIDVVIFVVNETSDSSADSYSNSISFLFQASATSLTFTSSSASANSPIIGNNTRTETYIQVTERQDLASTTDF